MEWNLRQQAAQKFLLYAYFGIVDSDDNDARAKKCAQRAYLDVNRTIEFNESLKESSGRNSYIKRQFQEKVSELIVRGIHDKIIPTNGDRDNFDKEHHLLCWMIIYESVKLKYNDTQILAEKLKYGQTQKWLNMTLKYMWLIGLLDDCFIDCLHVPVDRYIMEAAAGRNRKDTKLSTKGIDVDLPSKNGEKIKSYSDDKALSWSKWEGVEDFDEADKSDYHVFQYSIRDNLDKLHIECESPIEWEGDAWIKVAETVKKAEQKKFSDITFNFKISEET